MVTLGGALFLQKLNHEPIKTMLGSRVVKCQSCYQLNPLWLPVCPF